MWIYYLLAFLVLAALLGWLASAYLQEYFIFRPQRLRKDYRFEFEYPFEELWVKEHLNAVWFRQPKAKGVVLYFHGNAGSLKRWGKIAKDFVPRGWDLFIPDYRGFGKSTGSQSQAAMYQDAYDCYEFLSKQYDSANILIYGRSIGSAFAIYTASRHNPPLLLLETPFFNMSALFRSYYPWLPYWFRFKFDFPSNSFLRQIHCPILIFHGTKDLVVPYSHAQKLQAIAPEQITLITLPGASHKNCPEFPLYQQELGRVLGE